MFGWYFFAVGLFLGARTKEHSGVTLQATVLQSGERAVLCVGERDRAKRDVYTTQR